MWTPPRPNAACRAALAGLGSVLWTLPVAAQIPDSTRGRMPLAVDFRPDDWLALLAIVLCGAVGAFASDLVVDGGRLDRIRSEAEGWSLGFVAKLVVGAVAALVTLAMNPADEWWGLIGTALAAGVAGEAILLAILASRKAESAEREREKAEQERAKADEKTRGVAEMATRRFRAVSAAAVGARPGAGEESLGATEALPAGGDERVRTVAILAEQFGAEFSEIAGGTVRQRVRGILVSNLGHEDVDKRPLGEIGGKDAGVRRLIARDIKMTWEKDNLNPPWTDADVTEASTLRSLADEVDRRGGR